MFGTSGIRGPVGESVTADLALSVGRALASEGYERVVLGRDARESGHLLSDATAAGIMECGGTVLDVGVVATPTVARAVGWLEADAGVVITASHNPPTDNGIKLWTPSGRAFDRDEQAAIETRLEADSYALADWEGVGRRECRSVEHRHRAAIGQAVSVADPPPVVVDVGNGCGGITADALDSLGAHVRTLNAQRDGSFPGRPSEPTDETLESLCTLVGAIDDAIGVAHDGDADRLVAVDELGRFVPKDVLLALFARDAADAGDRVAVPVDTSLAVDDALAAVGASATRTRVGDVFVAERTTEPDVVFGGEPSGAWIWPDETACPDGPLAACKLLEIVDAADSLATLVDGIETYPIRRESLETDDRSGLMAAVESAVTDQYDDVSTLDGVRVRQERGWFLVRPSGTEPLVRITAEGRTEEASAALLEDARILLENAHEA